MTQVADYLVDPLCRGVFASSPRHLSLRSCFPQFHKYEAQFGSVTWGLLSEKEGKHMYHTDLYRKLLNNVHNSRAFIIFALPMHAI